MLRDDDNLFRVRVGRSWRLGSASVVFAKAARTGRLVCEVPHGDAAAGEIAALVAEIERVAR